MYEPLARKVRESSANRLYIEARSFPRSTRRVVFRSFRKNCDGLTQVASGGDIKRNGDIITCTRIKVSLRALPSALRFKNPFIVCRFLRGRTVSPLPFLTKYRNAPLPFIRSLARSLANILTSQCSSPNSRSNA